MLDELRKDFDAAHLGAVVNRAMGGEADIPTWADTRVEFDEYLRSEPQPVDSTKDLHMTALGLK